MAQNIEWMDEDVGVFWSYRGRMYASAKTALIQQRKDRERRDNWLSSLELQGKNPEDYPWANKLYPVLRATIGFWEVESP